MTSLDLSDLLDLSGPLGSLGTSRDLVRFLGPPFTSRMVWGAAEKAHAERQKNYTTEERRRYTADQQKNYTAEQQRSPMEQWRRSSEDWNMTAEICTYGPP